MVITVDQAFDALAARGAIETDPHIQSMMLVKYVERLLGRPAPKDLCGFYTKQISRVGDYDAVVPHWKPYTGWLSRGGHMDALLAVGAIPIFADGCGNLWGADILANNDHSAVYFFDHERGFAQPEYAAGSSIGAFLLLLSEHDQALDEKRPRAWELKIDDDLDRCPRAPPIWLADRPPYVRRRRPFVR
jgi:hypothetical protein